MLYRTKQFSELKVNKNFISKKSGFEKINYSSLKPSDDADNKNELYGKSVVVTGEFSRYTRVELIDKLLKLGAYPKSSVSKKTNVLFVGEQDIALVGEDDMSSKEEKAAELIAKGCDIRIIKDAELDDFFKKTESPIMATAP